MVPATNSSGFTALPGGMRASYNGSYNDFKSIGEYWTATSKNATNSYSIRIDYSYNALGEIGFPFRMGLSVRCVKD
jgi:hypothetical protein